MDRSRIICAILVIIGISCVRVEGAYREFRTLFSSCTGTQTDLPNLSHAKRGGSSTAPLASTNCTQLLNERPSSGPITWYYNENFPLSSGDPCTHNTSISTIDITDGRFTYEAGMTITTGTGKVVAGPFTGENVTLIAVSPTLDPTQSQCSTPVGLETRGFTTSILIGNGTELTCIGVLSTLICPGIH